MRDWLLDRLIAWPEQLNRVSLRMTGFRDLESPTSFGRLTYVEGEGQGRLPLMLLHGFSAEGPHFTALMHHLRSQVKRLIVPDLPAHGTSSVPPPSFSAGQLRKDMIDALDRMIVEPTVLYGNSLGGMVALHYAIARPEKVRGLFLCSPAGAQLPEPQLKALLRTFQLSGYDEALAFVDRLFVHRSFLRPLIAWGVQRKFANPALQALLPSLGPDVLLKPEELARLNVPTLLSWGREDHILPRACLDFFRAHLPKDTARIEEPEGQSHTPYLEDAEGVAARIVAFMRELERNPPRH